MPFINTVIYQYVEVFLETATLKGECLYAFPIDVYSSKKACEIKLGRIAWYFQSLPHQNRIIDTSLYYGTLVKYTFVYIRV